MKTTNETKVQTKVRNWLNWSNEDDTFEKENKLPSMTVPDLSMSVKELVERSQMGLPPEGERVPIYDEGQPFPDISRMDLAERQQFIKHYQNEVEKLLTPAEATKEAMKELQNEKQERKVLDEAYNDVLLDD